MPPQLRSITSPPRKAPTARRKAAKKGAPGKCRACGGPFRSRSRIHIYCARKTCRRKRRLEYMRKYMTEWKRAHPNYWRTDKQKQYLKRWRQEHPDYFRKYLAKWRKKNKAASPGGRSRKPGGAT